MKYSFGCEQVCVVVALGAMCAADQGEAFQINWSNRNFSAFDATERGVVDAAIEIWESIFDHNGSPGNSFNVFINKAPIDGSGNALGVTSQYGEHPSSGSPIGAHIIIDSADDGIFFDDPTPLLNNEFNPGANDYTFFAAPGSPAAGRIDLLTVVLHELGHGLGVHTLYSRWPPANAAELGLHLVGGTHTNPTFHPLDFMTPGRSSGVRALPSDIVIEALHSAFDYRYPGELLIHHWVSEEATGSWVNPANWDPAGTPGAAWTTVLENENAAGTKTARINVSSFVDSVAISGVGGTMNVEILTARTLFTNTVDIGVFGRLSGSGLISGDVVNAGGSLRPGFDTPAATLATQVPEPASAVLALIGLLVADDVGRRRRFATTSRLNAHGADTNCDGT